MVPECAMLRIALVVAAWPEAKQERRRSAFEGCDALLGNILGGVHDAGVDVSKLRKREKVRRVFGTVEHVRGGPIDRGRPRVGRGIRGGARVNLLGFKLPGVCHEVSFAKGVGTPRWVSSVDNDKSQLAWRHVQA